MEHVPGQLGSPSPRKLLMYRNLFQGSTARNPTATTKEPFSDWTNSTLIRKLFPVHLYARSLDLYLSVTGVSEVEDDDICAGISA